MGIHPDELRADFQRFYGLDLDGMGADYTCAHAASLAVALPAESATVRAERPEAAWSDEAYLLSAIEYDLRMLVWLNSEDGAKGRNRPRPIWTPADVAELADRVAGTDTDLIDRVLGITHGGDTPWQT